MTLRMMRKFYLPTVCIFILFLVFTIASGVCYGECDSCIVNAECNNRINMAQNFLNLQGDGPIVLHTRLKYDSIAKSTVCLMLNNVSICPVNCVRDSLGNLDIHFFKSIIGRDLKIYLENNIFILVGEYNSGDAFCAIQDGIQVPPRK